MKSVDPLVMLILSMNSNVNMIVTIAVLNDTLRRSWQLWFQLHFFGVLSKAVHGHVLGELVHLQAGPGHAILLKQFSYMVDFRPPDIMVSSTRAMEVSNQQEQDQRKGRVTQSGQTPPVSDSVSLHWF